MLLNLDHFLKQLEQAEALDDIQGLVTGLRDALDVKHAVYHWVSADGEQYGFGTYDPAWAQRYQTMEYLRIDPVILGCFQRFQPVDWKRLDWSAKQVRAFRLDAIEYGVGNQGYTVPIRGPNGQFALFTVSHDTDDATWSRFTLRHQRELILIGHYLNQKALSFEVDRSPEPFRPLSPREMDALTFLAMGYNRSQVAEMLTISEYTLRAYIESARLKLGAMNTIHAVSRALTEGLIVVGGSARAAAGGWPGRENTVENRADMRPVP